MAHYESEDPFDILDSPARGEISSPDAEEEELVSSIINRIESAANDRVSHDMEWEANRLMLIGEQTIVRKLDSTDVMRAVDVSDGMRRTTVDNELMVTDRAFVSKMTRIIPGVTVSPATADREDLLAAQVRESYLEYYTERNDLRRLYKRAVEYFSTCGTAIIHNKWDHLGGRELSVCEACGYFSEHMQEDEPCPVCTAQNAMGQQFGQPHEEARLTRVREGEPRTILIDPRMFYPEPGAADVWNPDGTKMHWCGIKRAMHVADIRQFWPETGMNITSDEGLYDDIWLAYHGSLSRGGNPEIQPHWIEDHAMVYEFHTLPTGEHPEGLIAFVCNGRLLDMGPNPYAKLFGRLPFYPLRFYRHPNEFWGMPIINQQADLQKDLNRLLTQRRDHRAMTLLPRVVVEQGSGVSKDDLTVRPGEVLMVHKNAAPPRYMEMPNWPQSAIAEEDYYRNSIRMKAGVLQNDVGISTGDTSGRFAAMQAAQSAELIGPLIIENVSEWLAIHRDVLILAQAYENPDKRWLVTGQDSYTMHAWSMVGSDRNAWNVRLDEVDITAQNPVLRRQLAMELLGVGYFNDNPENPQMPNMRAFARFARLKFPGSGIDLKSNEYTYAAQIPERIARGEQFQPTPEDDAAVFAEELLGWLRGAGRRAPEQLRQQIRQLWLFYSQLMRPNVYSAQAMPNPQQLGMGQGQQQQQPQPQGGGGLPRKPQGGGPGAPPVQGQMPGAQPGANDLIREADAGAEFAARGNKPHEG